MPGTGWSQGLVPITFLLIYSLGTFQQSLTFFPQQTHSKDLEE